ncbi:MAG: hypothetical protein F7C34_03405 [Desulfurococcales archaeon]|nr:hypothetical protein [Desulfurococcales archaeon]
MEEAVVEAIVLVSLIAISTVLGSYMVYSSVLSAKALDEERTKNLALDIAYSLAKACGELYRPDKYSGYTSTHASVALTGRETVRIDGYGIIVNPDGPGRHVIQKSTLEDLCSRVAGEQVSIELVPGTSVGSTLTFLVARNNNTVRIEISG